MIAVLTDKFKGTLTGRQVADIICDVLDDCVYVPMADGGEGTVEALGATRQGNFYIFEESEGLISAYVPTCGEGIPDFDECDWKPLLERSSAPAGKLVVEALKFYRRVFVGIGGTQVADGGEGFADQLYRYVLFSTRNKLIGLADVKAPLIAKEGVTALSFIEQKGAKRFDEDVLKERFWYLKKGYGKVYNRRDNFGAAGGGIGFAMELLLRQDVLLGAEYILERNIKAYLGGRRPDLIIMGEGCVDEQTTAGKVVDVVNAYGKAHHIPVVTFAGMVEGNVMGIKRGKDRCKPKYPHIIPTVNPYGPILTPYRAAENLRRTVIESIPLIKKLMS